MKREGKGFSRRVTPLFPTMMVQAQEQIEPIADEAANEENVPTHSNDPLLSGEDSLKLNDLMEICTKLQQRVLDLENTKTAQAQEILSLKLRVKRLEKKGGPRTHKLKRPFKVGRSAQVVSSEDEGLGDQDDASKQGRKITDIDQDAEVTLVDETQGRYDDAQMFDTNVFNGEEVFVAEQSEKVVEEVVSTVEVSVAATITTKEITLAQALAELRSAKPKDKGKLRLIEPEKPLKMKEQIRLDEELAFKLQAEEEEQARLAREKAEKVEEANQEELTDEEKARLFVELLEKRKKHFAALRAQEKRNKPPTKAQKKVTMYYLKIHGWLQAKSIEEQESSKKAEAEMAQESSSKRAREELEQEVANKQKMEDDKEKKDLKKCFEIVQDNEVAIDAIPLATKPVPIVNFQIHRKGRNGYYEIMRADGSAKTYLLPEEGYKRVLWDDLKTMFEHHVEDLIWRNLQGKKVLLWRLYDSYGMPFVRLEDMHVYMLVEKRYPLTPAAITDILNKKLQADYWNEMCYQLLKLMTKQLKKNNWAKHGLKRIMMNSKGFIFFKIDSKAGLEAVLEGVPWLIRKSPIILKKWSMDTRLLKEEFTRILILVKLHDVPIQVFEEDGISLIATFIGKPIMLDSYTSSMCNESWARSSFARCLIKVNSEADLVGVVQFEFPHLLGVTSQRNPSCPSVKQNVSYEPNAPTSASKKGDSIVGNATNSSSLLKNIEDEEDEEHVENVYDETANLFPKIKTGGVSYFTAAVG
ncbi:putative ribonuclease H-like domain-containing protein [Tanacetum coccineum]